MASFAGAALKRSLDIPQPPLLPAHALPCAAAAPKTHTRMLRVMGASGQGTGSQLMPSCPSSAGWSGDRMTENAPLAVCWWRRTGY